MAEPLRTRRGFVAPGPRRLAPLWRACAFALLAIAGGGCASTVKQAAREAAPAAVEEGVQQAQKPETRADLAEIIADPRIREASTALSAAITEGVLNGLTDAEHSERLQRLTDVLMARAGSSLARSFRSQLGPAIEKLVADTLDQSLQRLLDQQTEQRLQALATVLARSTVRGIGDALLDPAGHPTPVLQDAFGQVVHEAGYQAAFGFAHAVRDAREQVGPEASDDHSVLATLGTLADWSRGVPVVIVGGLALLLLAVAAGLAWALVRLRRLRRSHAPHAA